MTEEVRQKIIAEYKECKKIATYLYENRESELIKNLLFPYFTYVGIEIEGKVFKRFNNNTFKDMMLDTLTRITEKYSKECNHDFPLFFEYSHGCDNFYCLDCGRVFETEDPVLVDRAKKNSDDLLTRSDISYIVNATEECRNLDRYFMTNNLIFDSLDKETDNLITFSTPIRQEYLEELLINPSQEALKILRKKRKRNS